MNAQLLRTVLALQIVVRIFRKPFRMQVKGNLPANKQCYGQCKQAPRITPFYKKQRSEHHGIVPVIYPAGAAAFIFHEPRLEGTEEQNADDITNGIRAAQQDHNTVIQNVCHI